MQHFSVQNNKGLHTSSISEKRKRSVEKLGFNIQVSDILFQNLQH